MKKLLRKKDLLLLTIAGIGDVLEEMRDPLHLVSKAYENMYGFLPREYKRHNFLLTAEKSLKVGNIERIIKKGKAYLRITTEGKDYLKREFPITALLKNWNKKWIIVIFDIKETSRKYRNQLRDKLKSIGFGMLQQSAWITPLPIGEDIKEIIAGFGLSDHAFVLEVSDVLLGDPKLLANRVWGLDKLEEKYSQLKEAGNGLLKCIRNPDGRHEKGYKEIKEIEEKIKKNKREVLSFLVTLPPLPENLYPSELRKVLIISFSQSPCAR